MCRGKVSCLRKQHDGRDWASNHRPSDLKFNELTTTPPSPGHKVGEMEAKTNYISERVPNFGRNVNVKQVLERLHFEHTFFLFFSPVYRCKEMAKSGYKKISNDGDTEKISYFSLLFFQWMNKVFKTGSQRPLEESDFLPISEENTSRFVINQLEKKWEKEKT